MSFLANIYKDLKIYFTKNGLISAILALILPLFLLPTLIFGVDDLSSQKMVTSFPIAIRDNDNTPMSHSLITQLREIDLFSQVRLLTKETDNDAIAAGAVAVATIPKDFFYDLYTMSDCPVNVTVNSAFPVQSELFVSVFRSVMGIIDANHAAAIGVYTFVYGDLTPELISQMRAETGDKLVYDALGRQRFFADLAVSPDLPAALTRRLSACVLGVMAIFFALTSAKTLPEERRLGVLPRLRATGTGISGFVLSKLLSAALLSLPVVALSAALIKMSFFYVLVVYLALLVCAFSVMGTIAAAANSAATTQRIGNVILLLSLVLGGTLWPSAALPELLRPLSNLALPHYAQMALEARASGLDFYETAGLLWPLAVIAAVPPLLLPLVRALPVRQYQQNIMAAAGELPESGRTTGTLYRAVRLTVFRLRQATGGPGTLILTLAAALVCGLCARELRAPGAGSLRIAVWDRDGTELSAELVEALGSSQGVDVAELSGDSARRALLTGEREGLVIIGRGYGRAMIAGEATPLTFEAAPSSVSARAARELVAGRAVAQYRALEAQAEAAAMLGRELDETDILRLRQAISAAAEQLPPLYNVTYTEGQPPADPFAPGPVGLGCLAALFTLLTAGAYAAAPDARSADRRLRAIPGGPAVGIISDMGALTGLGLAVMLLVVLPAGEGPEVIPAAIAGSLCMASLSLLLNTVSAAEGRVDTLAPLAALFICILGGSFMDTSVLAGGLRAATYLSPAALAALPWKISVPALLAYAAVLLASVVWKRVAKR